MAEISTREGLAKIRIYPYGVFRIRANSIAGSGRGFGYGESLTTQVLNALYLYVPHNVRTSGLNGSGYWRFVLSAGDAAIHLVDDDDAVRDSLKTLLESYGLAVREYKSAVDFLNAPGTRNCGCLILDLHLPVLSGLDLIGIMRERAVQIPVVFITGRSDKETRERAMRAGAVAFLDKPVGEGPLMAAVCSALTSAATCRVYGGAPSPQPSTLNQNP